MSYLEHIEIERTGPGTYRLRWPANTCPAPRRIEASSHPDALAALAASISIGADSAEIGELPATGRHFFHLHWNDSHAVVVDRHVPLQGARNFRDFGGYLTGDGRRVRWGHLYRSGQLGALTAQDQVLVEQLGIRLICDFRRDSERSGEPNRLAQTHRPRVENLPIAPGNTSSVFIHFGDGARSVTREQVAQMMVDINRDLALQQSAYYRRMFEVMLEEDGPLLVHCAVGKDRTGLAAALILAALGVPESTIMRDYLLTARYLSAQEHVQRLLEKNGLQLDPALMLPLLEARDVYLQAALDAIREQYGNMEDYLREMLGVDAAARAELRRRLLLD